MTVLESASTGLVALGLACAGLVVSPATAEAEDSWGLRPFAGAHVHSETSVLGRGGISTVSNTALVGLRLWQRLGELASVEAELPLGLTDSRDGRATLLVTGPRLHGRITTPTGDTIRPFFVGGAAAPAVLSNKQSSVNSDITVAAYAGGGVELNLKGLTLAVEARYFAVPGLGDDILAHEMELLLTASLPSFKRKKRLPPPPPDQDRDGINDEEDKCIADPEDHDGYQDEDGCPELDNDGDGVVDGLDECQKKAETINGFQDDDGCPDEVNEELRLLQGVVTGLRFEAGSAVFDYGNESDETEVEHIPELDRITGLMRKYPSVKIVLIGHSDDREIQAEPVMLVEGEEPPEPMDIPAALEELSRERAASVRDYLVEQGIGVGRIIILGRGSDEPFADNETASGRRANRRVELELFHPVTHKGLQTH